MEKIRITREEFDEMLREQEELAEEMKDEIPSEGPFYRTFEEAYGMYEILEEKNFYLDFSDEYIERKCPVYIRGNETLQN